MRKVLVAAIAASSMLLVPGSALAGQDPPAEFAPPAAAPVVDVASAEAFAKRYVAQTADRRLRSDRRRVRVLNVDARCLQSPLVETRFGCVFTLRALVIQRRGGWDWGHKGGHARSAGRGDDDRRGGRRYRVRQFGCLGALTINGGPTVTPSAQVRFAECARIPRGDTEVVAPTDD